MIEFHGVSHRYGERVVLTDISLTVGERRVAFIGANGSGKSTLARMVNGLVSPTAGHVVVNGLEVATDGRSVRRQVGFVFADPDSQIVMPTVAEDVAFSLRRSGLPKAGIDRKVTDILDAYGLAGHRDHPAHLLSGGQKQLLALIAVLVVEPKVLVCDEPTTLLDLPNKRKFAALLDELPQQVLLVTHDLDAVASFDRVIVLDQGRVVADDVPEPAVTFYRTLVG
ncbi:energy-coupling factor ABC transporter ATP-binding protein [Fodinicola acaciae]|uniref:energy-coupling factor ABC transporter ATP-binding protein n=1 Tax=Fodinicola acaciae TaxID=2681555 RepID=UPI0013D40AC4|nr:ABC transporter ATP-binding protein [Fodinicola acaciae]